MDPRRRTPRLFLDHKPPLVAFMVVAIACALMLVHVARSDAAPGWLRAGLGGAVAQRVVEATLLEPDPVPDRITEAARPHDVATPEGTPRSDGASGSVDPGSSGVTGGTGASGGSPGQPHNGGIGVVDLGPADGGVEPESPADTDASDDADATDDVDPGPGQGHGNGHQGRGEGRDEQPVSDVIVPGASEGPDPRDHHGSFGGWFGGWFGGGPGGHGHHGDQDDDDDDRGHGPGGHGGHGEHGHGDDGDDDRGDDDRGDDDRSGHGHGGPGGGHGGHGGGHGRH